MIGKIESAITYIDQVTLRLHAKGGHDALRLAARLESCRRTMSECYYDLSQILPVDHPTKIEDDGSDS